ncbi:MAG: hypothetical protein U0Q18_12330 [Bryobacteraceae bacterium]
MFLTVTHYECWTLVDETGEFNMPAFFEIEVKDLGKKQLTIDAKFPENMAKAVALGFSSTADPALGKLFLGGIEMPAVPVLKSVVQSPPALPIWGIKFMPANRLLLSRRGGFREERLEPGNRGPARFDPISDRPDDAR